VHGGHGHPSIWVAGRCLLLVRRVGEVHVHLPVVERGPYFPERGRAFQQGHGWQAWRRHGDRLRGRGWQVGGGGPGDHLAVGELRSVIAGVGRRRRDELAGGDLYPEGDRESDRAVGIGRHDRSVQVLLAFAKAGGMADGVTEEVEGVGGVGRAGERPLDRGAAAGGGGRAQYGEGLIVVAVLDEADTQSRRV